MGRWVFVGVLMAMASSASEASADLETTDTATKTPEPPSRLTPKTYASTLALGLSAGAIKLFHPYPRFGFRGGLIFDDAVRTGLRLQSEEDREIASLVSDFLQVGLMAAPFIETAALYSLDAIDGRRAWERSLIDAQSIAIAMSVLVTTKTFVGRLRPKTQLCPGGESDLSCASAPLRMSFVSGHTTAAFTGAGLLCAHDRGARPAYSLENWTCPTALALASGTGLLRIMSDNHYATDVIGGAALGLVSGYVIPRLLHYSEKSTCSSSTCLQSRLPGQANIYAQLGTRISDTETLILGGASLNLEQEYRYLPQRRLAAILRAEATLESTLGDKQFQTLNLISGLTYQDLGLGWLGTWSSLQRSNLSVQEFEHGASFFARYRLAPQKALRAQLVWYPGSSNARAYTLSIEFEFGHWWTMKSEFKSASPGLQANEYLFNAGLGLRLPWNKV